MIPIPDAIQIVRTALYQALSPLCGIYNGLPKCYWLVAEQGATLPLIIYQSQDSGGADASRFGMGGWEGLITIRALANCPSAVETQLTGVPAAMEAMANPAGYTIRATLRRPLTLPPTDGIWQAGLIYLVQLYRI